jgi:hypothetical protein
MGKVFKSSKNKIENDEEDDPCIKLTREERLRSKDNKYPHVKGPYRRFITITLNKVAKAPRIKSTFMTIIQGVEQKQKEVGDEDVELNALSKQLNEFVNPRDTRQAANFNNYEYKFELKLE